MIQPIVMAAGLGSRMGAIKALLPIGRQTALQAVLRTVSDAALPPALVVLGHSAPQILKKIPLDKQQLVINSNPETGLGCSLKLALRRVDHVAQGVIVFHTDMPFITVSTVRAVVEAATAGAPMAAPLYRAQRGFPVYFAQAHLHGLMQSLTGDRGGQAYLAARSESLVLIPVDDPGCLKDIDCPQDFHPLRGDMRCSIRE